MNKVNLKWVFLVSLVLALVLDYFQFFTIGALFGLMMVLSGLTLLIRYFKNKAANNPNRII